MTKSPLKKKPKKFPLWGKLLMYIGGALLCVSAAFTLCTLYLNSFQYKYREKELTTSIHLNGKPQKQSYIISGSTSLNYKVFPRYVRQDRPVVIVSLTEVDEQYLLKGGMAASYIGLDPYVNCSLSQEVKLFFRRLLQGVYFTPKVALIDEKSMAEKHNYVFYKLGIPRSRPPEEETVAHLRKILLAHPGAHIHFHCNRGRGRTTSAMAIATFFLSNSSLEVILSDMRHLGGVDLKDIKIWNNSTYTREQLLYRYNKIKEIYEYAQAVGLEGGMSLSEWREQQARAKKTPSYNSGTPTLCRE